MRNKNTTTNNTTDNTTTESFMEPTARPPRRLTSADLRAAREEMDAKVASFETLAGISGRTRQVLDAVDEEVDAEWRRLRRSGRANSLAARAAIATRGVF